MINWKLEKINLTIARIVNMLYFKKYLLYILKLQKIKITGISTTNKCLFYSVQQVESGGICCDINCQRNMQYMYIVGKTYEIYF